MQTLFCDCRTAVAVVQHRRTPQTPFTPGHHIPGQVGQRNSSGIPFRICSGGGAVMTSFYWRLFVFLIFVSLSGLARCKSECFSYIFCIFHRIIPVISMISLLQWSSSFLLFVPAGCSSRRNPQAHLVRPQSIPSTRSLPCHCPCSLCTCSRQPKARCYKRFMCVSLRAAYPVLPPAVQRTHTQ